MRQPMVKSNPPCSKERWRSRSRKVNEVVIPDSYAMPDVQELLDQLGNSQWFTSLDLSSAFWQLPLAEESRDCTAYMTKTHGLLRWKAMQWDSRTPPHTSRERSMQP